MTESAIQMKDHSATLPQQQFDERMQRTIAELPHLKASLSIGPSDGWFVLNVENMGAPIYEVNVSASSFPIRDSRDSTTKLSIHLPQLGVSESHNDLALFSAKIAVDKGTNDAIHSGGSFTVSITYHTAAGLPKVECFKLVLGG